MANAGASVVLSFAFADLMDGSVDAMFDAMPSSISHIKSGKLVPLAVTGASRSEALPAPPPSVETSLRS